MLHVPERSFPLGMTETAMKVQVSLTRHFKIPAWSQLASAVYWLSCTLGLTDFVHYWRYIANFHPSHYFQLSTWSAMVKI